MGRIPNILAEHRRYVESGVWKCSKSPTGAHYWIIESRVMVCKYCKERRKVPREVPRKERRIALRNKP